MSEASALGWGSSTQQVLDAFPAECKKLEASCVIVTGCNTGIGVPTALALATTGARIVFACRSRAKALAAIDGVVEAGKGAVAREKLSFLPLDLSSMRSTRDFVEAFLESQARNGWGPLSLLVCNAGIFNTSGTFEQTGDGFEKAFQVNFLSNVVLIKGLIPALRAGISAGQTGRVVLVSSDSHFGPLNTRDVQNRDAVLNLLARPGTAAEFAAKGLTNVGAYGSSKLLANLWIKEAARREQGQLDSEKGVAFCALHPGSLIATDVARDSTVLSFFLKYFVSLFTKSVDQGASTTVFACVCPRHLLAGGAYFRDCARTEKVSKLSRGDDGAAAAKLVYDLAEELVVECLNLPAAGRTML